MALVYNSSPLTSGSGSAMPGLSALWNYINQNFPGVRFGGIGRTSKIPGGSTHSVHYEGRALDTMVDQLGAGRVAMGDAIAAWAVANADALGVQEIVWNGMEWGFGTWSWRPRADPKDHWNHVHIGLNTTAAARHDLNLAAISAPGAAPKAQGSGAPAPAPDKPMPFNPPADSDYVQNEAGWGFLMYDVGGAHIAYMVPPDGSVNVAGLGNARKVTDAEWTALNPVDGGMANELESVSKDFGTFKGWFDSILMTVMGKSNPAHTDPEVRRVLAEFAGRPDMSTQELQNRLQGTKWYQSRTQTELQWDNLPEAERNKQRGDTAARIKDAWLQFAGLQLPNDNAIMGYTEQVASGKMGFGSFIEQIIKPNASKITESPWSREIRDAQEATKQRPVDIDNTAIRVMDLAHTWGVNMPLKAAAEWGQKLVEKQASDQDLLVFLKAQAQVLYPWKNPEMDTKTAAGPWTETYGRVMEKKGDVFTPEVAQALTAGTSVWDFEQSLKKSDAWLGTNNARGAIMSAAETAGRKFGLQ